MVRFLTLPPFVARVSLPKTPRGLVAGRGVDRQRDRASDVGRRRAQARFPPGNLLPALGPAQRRARRARAHESSAANIALPRNALPKMIES